ncbi:MAG: twin-arginine translocase subunit TatB [Thermomicrobiales bacterium]|nr:twin-arginine translocase subunit TatB [Thermomicrobiales bacterium]
MFGVGYQEMFVILVIALVVFGPQRLPELASQAGRWVREFRKMTSDLTGEFEKTIAEVDDIKETVRREMQGMMDEVDSVGDSVKRDLSGSKSAKPKPVTARSGGAAASTATGSKSSTSGARKAAPAKTTGNGKVAVLPVATKADPLIDVSALDDDLLMGPTTKNGNGAADVVQVDEALVRVRRRRAAASYSRRV